MKNQVRVSGSDSVLIQANIGLFRAFRDAQHAANDSGNPFPILRFGMDCCLRPAFVME